jgi:hypothetical protein
MSDKSGLVFNVFVDALGWELMRGRAFLQDEIVVRRPLDTVLGYSSTCDPTIITGRWPREHGHFTFYAYDPDRSPFRGLQLLSALPAWLANRGRVRRLLSRSVARAYGYTGYFQLYSMPFNRLPLFDYTEKRDFYEPGGINGGQPTIFDWLGREGVPTHRTDWRSSERAAIDALADDLREGRPRFVYLYLAGLDGILHAHGTTSPLVDAHLAFYERELRNLLHLARRHYGNVRFHLFSDHGMTDVTSTCDLMARVEATGLRFGIDYAAAYDSTLARFWFLRPGSRDTITRALRDESAGRILRDEELQALGCDFPDHRYGELFFLLNAGVLLCPSFLGLAPLKGMHGYHPSEPTAQALFASNAADATPPRGLTDLYSFFQREAATVIHNAHEVAA